MTGAVRGASREKHLCSPSSGRRRLISSHRHRGRDVKCLLKPGSRVAHLLRRENRPHPEHFSAIECSKLMDGRHELSAEQIRLARALLGWSRVRLASKANLSEAT